MVSFFLFQNNPTVVRVPAGSALFREGDPGGIMYALVHGCAEVAIGNRTVENLVAGSVVGEMGLVDHLPRSATVIATADCEFVAIDEKRFKYMVAQTPHFALQVMQVMAERLRRADRLIPPLEDI